MSHRPALCTEWTRRYSLMQLRSHGECHKANTQSHLTLAWEKSDYIREQEKSVWMYSSFQKK